MTRAFVALGANLGEPVVTLREALGELSGLGELCGVSRLYRTAPVGGPAGQPDYFNAAVGLQTSLTAAELLAALHAIEVQAGRTRTVRWEARTLDLDLILYGEQISTDPALALPHPRAWERAFVLIPLHDLDPKLKHPLTGETVADALRRVGGVRVELAAKTWAVPEGQ